MNEYNIKIRFGKANWVGRCRYKGIFVISQGATIPELLTNLADAFSKADDYLKTETKN